jgi:probable HAF family extracellular repeat protein
MKPVRLTCVTVMVFLAALTAQAQPQKPHKARYIVKDLGTLGGTVAESGGISNSGWVEGFATLPPDDSVIHSFLWRNGVMMDLGTLGGPNSFSEWQPNDFGNAGGYSDTAIPDPNGEDACGFGTQLICRAFYWAHGKMIPQPALGGNNSSGYGLNNLGEMAGTAENKVVEPTCDGVVQIFQFKPVIWILGRVFELPTVGGDPVGVAYAVNDLGEAVGQTAPCDFSTSHAVLWKNGKAIDLGSLGGSENNSPQGLNTFGQVVGYSGLAGDETFHAFLWQKGKMTDLGTLPGDVHSVAETINSSGQIVGRSSDASFNGSGYVWQNGVMTDFNTLIPADSPLYVIECTSNNDLGQIVGIAVDSAGNTHAFLATPVAGAGGESALSAPEGETLRRPRVSENIRQGMMLHSRIRTAIHQHRFDY